MIRTVMEVYTKCVIALEKIHEKVMFETIILRGCIGLLLSIPEEGTTYGKHGGLRKFSMFEKLFMVQCF